MQPSVNIRGWIIPYAVAAPTDIVQIVIDFTGVGEIVNEIIDPIIGIVFALYFWRRGDFTMMTAIEFFMAIIAKEGTFGAAPAWTVVVGIIHFQSTLKQAGPAAGIVQGKGSINGQPANLPKKAPPLNQGGKRLPNA